MDDITTLGAYLRAERERRELTLKTISEGIKVSVPLLEGLESDDISKWPGGIFRRAFVRSYADAVGLDPDAVLRRFEQQHRPAQPEVSPDSPLAVVELAALEQARPARNGSSRPALAPSRARYLGTAADLTVALVLAFGSAAAGSRLLWPVLMIAAYYAIGVLLTGTSPMVALLSQAEAPAAPAAPPAESESNVDPFLDHSSAGSAL